MQLPQHTEPATPGDDADWVAWLADQPEAPVAMIPFPPGPSSVDYADTTTAMLLALDHGDPLVNGYSGFFPSRFVALRKEMAAFPSAGTLAALEDLDVRFLVVDNAWLTDTRRDQMERLGIAPTPAFTGADRSVFELPH